MKRILLLLAIGALGAWTTAAQTTASGQAGASAQSQASAGTNKAGAQTSSNGMASNSSSANAGNNSASISNGSKINATLANSLDAKKSKPGDQVEARATEDVKQDGKVVLKKGTRLIGHVTQAQARANGQTQSQLGIMFDHAVLKNGQQMPFNASIQALAAAQSATAASADTDNITASGGGMAQGSARSGSGLAGGVASTAGATAGAASGTVMNTASSVPSAAGGSLNSATRSTGAVGGLTSTGRLESNSSGVFGLEGLSLNSAASNATQGSLIVSTTKNVHLESGTQLLLQTTAQAQ
jgi:antigen 43